MSKLCPLNFQQKAWRLFFAAKVSINVNLSTSSLVLIASNQFFFQKIIDRLSKKGFASRASPLKEKSRNLIPLFDSTSREPAVKLFEIGL